VVDFEVAADFEVVDFEVAVLEEDFEVVDLVADIEGVDLELVRLLGEQELQE
jgi:hypothetical protein